MSDTLSTLLQLLLQETGGNEDTWGELLNDTLENVEQAIAGTTTKVVVTGTYTLTDNEARSAVLALSGTLTDNVTVEVPAHSKAYFVRNETSQGAFKVYLKVAGQAALTELTAGGFQTYVCSGSALSSPTAGGGIPIGSIIDFAGPATPANYLVCDGSAISRVTFANLFAAIGSTWGAGDGSTTFNLPNAADRYRRGSSGTYGVGVSLSQDVQSHTHTGSFTIADHVHSVGVTINPAGTHNHSYSTPGASVGSPGGTAGFFFGSGTGLTASAPDHTHTTTVSETPAGGGSVTGTIAATGGTETRPNSIVTLAIIRFN
jgi:microcystin-dependent protein